MAGGGPFVPTFLAHINKTIFKFRRTPDKKSANKVPSHHSTNDNGSIAKIVSPSCFIQCY